MTQAYVIASMSRAKKLPKLEKLLVKVKKQAKPRQTMAQQIAIARMWAALGYGKIKQVKV